MTTPTPRTDEVVRKCYAGYANGSLPVLLEELAKQLERDLAAAQEWREAVLNELIVAHIYTKEHDTNPRKAIQDAITWNCQVALDPVVSSDAQKLIAAAQEELRAIGDHVGGGAFYRNEHGGRLPLRDQVGQQIAELNQQLASAREVLASKDAELASVKAHAEAMRDWIRAREWTTAEPIALVVAYDRAAHLKDAP